MESPRRILVIEDNPSDACLLRRWLVIDAPGRYEVVVADRLATAFARLDEGRFDVVMADLNLPDAWGLETVERLTPRLGDVPLIVTTGNDDERAARDAVRAGAQDFLVKGHMDSFLVRRSIEYALERQRLELALEESQGRFCDFATASCDWFWETDAQLRVTYLSEGVERVLGAPPQRFIGSPRPELLVDPPVLDGEGWAEHCEDTDAHRAFQDFEYGARLDDGQIRYIRISAIPFVDRRGAFRGYRGVGSDITERHILEERLARLALHDSLTDLPNRACFEDVLQRAAARAERHGEAVAILYLDLDGFKAVNDSFGHEGGDLLLRAVAHRLLYFTRGEDWVARLGGDEFAHVMVVPLADAFSHATNAARRIIDALGEPLDLPGGTARIGASVGIAVFPVTDSTVAGCVRLADAAMYTAKRAGKSRWAIAPATDEARAATAAPIAPATVDATADITVMA
jgi:diguanylate cyclase (GGDEF)-like protein/PAS domain S-box-containing protein